MAKNYEENPADFHGSTCKYQTKLIANCHLERKFLDNYSSKSNHHSTFGSRNGWQSFVQ
jgi:hypothetical protein